MLHSNTVLAIWLITKMPGVHKIMKKSVTWFLMCVSPFCGQQTLQFFSFFLFFFCLGFLSRTFTIHRTACKVGCYLFNSSIPLPSASHALRHQLGNCCRELTSAHSQQAESKWEPLVFERKSLTTKFRVLRLIQLKQLSIVYQLKIKVLLVEDGVLQ